MSYQLGRALLAIVLFSTVLPLAHASQGDRVQFGSSITVGEGEEAGSLVCIGCSVHVQGTSGDIVAIGGSVVVEGTVKGDIVALGGNSKFTDSAEVSGDVVTIGGQMWRDPNAVIKGDITSQGGTFILPLLIVIPLLPVAAIIALVWWLVTRDRRAVPVRA